VSGRDGELDRRLEEAGTVQVKRDETPDDARLRRERERVTFYAALAAAGILFILSVVAMAVLPEADSRRVIAERMVPLFVGGLVGFLFGRKTA
jgi:hypothetical protein